MVLPPRAKAMDVPAFCVEPSRWQGQASLAPLGVSAPLAVREAILQQDQRKVWDQVAQFKLALRQGLTGGRQPTTQAADNSSIAVEYREDAYRQAIGPYETGLAGALEGLDRPVGMVYAVDGRLYAADIYASNSLFKAAYPRLLRAAAADALASEGKAATPPTRRQVAQFLEGACQGKWTRQDWPGENTLLRLETDSSYARQLLYQRTLVHLEVVQKTESSSRK
jgi:hypothetical protein